MPSVGGVAGVAEVFGVDGFLAPFVVEGDKAFFFFDFLLKRPILKVVSHFFQSGSLQTGLDCTTTPFALLGRKMVDNVDDTRRPWNAPLSLERRGILCYMCFLRRILV